MLLCCSISHPLNDSPFIFLVFFFFFFVVVVVVVSVERVLYCNYCHHCNYTFKSRPVIVRPIHVQGKGEMKTRCSWKTSREKAKSYGKNKREEKEEENNEKPKIQVSCCFLTGCISYLVCRLQLGGLGGSFQPNCSMVP